MPTPVLDVTRLFSRRGMHFDTGIDRIERAYLHEISRHHCSKFLVRRNRTYFLLPRETVNHLIEKRGKFDYFKLAKYAERIGYQSIALPEKAHFFHIGHTGHTNKFWRRLAETNIKRTIYLHDAIPLDFPELMRGASAQEFKSRFDQWNKFGQVVLTNSHYSKTRIAYHMNGDVEIVVAPPAPGLVLSAPSTDDSGNYLMIGTIEPRKNHATIFAAWEALHARLGDDCPILHLVGKRGWADASVFEWLDNSPLVGRFVIEHGAVDDEQLTLIAGRCSTLLMPSLVEGYGLPALETALSGYNLILSDIAAFREIFPDEGQLFVPPTDVQAWVNAIIAPKRSAPKPNLASFSPDWHRYFANNPII